MEQKYWQEFVFGSKNILLLQGPIGPFFYQFGQYLKKNYDKKVYKLNFNGGDLYYYPTDAFTSSFNASVCEFKSFLQRFIQERSIDAIVCFGHHRAYHVLAKELCLESAGAVSFWAFEEGYLRPHYITFEKWGVNDDSQISKDASSYKKSLPFYSYQEPTPVASGFIPRAWYACNYYMACYQNKKIFSRYTHHREVKLLRYTAAWFCSAWRKIFYKPKEYLLSKSVEQGLLDDFFIVPLQVHNDSQVLKFGSGYSVPSFIRCVLLSFAKNSLANQKLVIKHHPMDRGFNHYGQLIEKLSKHYGVADRVYYVFDVSLPVLLRKANGMVVLNSTCGISAMIHGMPVKALGGCQYNFAGLTDQKSLDDFWHNPTPPNAEIFQNYRSYLLYKTQLNANFYRKHGELDSNLRSCFTESNVTHEA